RVAPWFAREAHRGSHARRTVVRTRGAPWFARASRAWFAARGAARFDRRVPRGDGRGRPRGVRTATQAEIPPGVSGRPSARKPESLPPVPPTRPAAHPAIRTRANFPRSCVLGGNETETAPQS